MFARMIDDFKESTGIALRLTSLAMATAVTLFIAIGFLCAAAFVYVLQNYGLIEACLTGAGVFTIFSRIMLPLGKPALATVALFTFVDSWNDLLGPLIYIDSESKKPLSLGIFFMSQAPYGINYALFFAFIKVGTPAFAHECPDEFRKATRAASLAIQARGPVDTRGADDASVMLR